MVELDGTRERGVKGGVLLEALMTIWDSVVNAAGVYGTPLLVAPGIAFGGGQESAVDCLWPADGFRGVHSRALATVGTPLLLHVRSCIITSHRRCETL
jgi:hypothetical protein